MPSFTVSMNGRKAQIENHITRFRVSGTLCVQVVALEGSVRKVPRDLSLPGLSCDALPPNSAGLEEFAAEDTQWTFATWYRSDALIFGDIASTGSQEVVEYQVVPVHNPLASRE